MGITVSTQNMLTELIKDRINKKIAEIKADGRTSFAALVEQAKNDVHEKGGTKPAAERFFELRKTIEEADRECRMIDHQLKQKYPKASDYGYSSYPHDLWTEGFDHAVAKRANVLFKATEAGVEVAALERAMDDLQLIVLTATSNAQLNGLIEKVNKATGYEPSAFEKEVLS